MHELIESEKDARRLVDAQNLYVIRQKESEIGQLEFAQTKREQQLKDQVKLRNFLFLIIGLCIIVVALTYYLYVLNQRANKSLRVANAQVSHQNEKLQQLNATKDKFFSIIGHDLRGPLNSLTSFSGLLMNHTDSLSKEEIQTVAKDLDKSIKNLFVLLENLLEWSRAQAGVTEFRPDLFDLVALIDDNKALLKNQAQQKNITLVNRPMQPVTIKAHKQSINTVVRNLVSNAIKFTPPGGTITIDVQPGKSEVLVTVADTGVGIPKDVLQQLFRLDTKHSTRGTANEKGTGLGLILSKEFVERNGGSIGVSSEEGKGSTFYFTIPIVP
jgi:signal transduction histidine kinase